MSYSCPPEADATLRPPLRQDEGVAGTNAQSLDWGKCLASPRFAAVVADEQGRAEQEAVPGVGERNVPDITRPGMPERKLHSRRRQSSPSATTILWSCERLHRSSNR